MSRVSIVINCDTRPGSGDADTEIGRYGSGSLQGCRNYDFLIEGVKNKRDFFSGTDFEIILVVDEVEPIPEDIREKMERYAERVEVRKFDHNRYRFNDMLYLESLALAEGEYVVHFDQDAMAYRDPNSNIVQQYFEWLNDGVHKFICQPSPLTYDQHGMDHASTRAFICKRESLDIPELTACLDDGYRRKNYGSTHCPALEHIIGLVAGLGSVYYPSLDWNDHVIASWVTYRSGLYAKLDTMTYPEIVHYLRDISCFAGANDIIAGPL